MPSAITRAHPSKWDRPWTVAVVGGAAVAACALAFHAWYTVASGYYFNATDVGGVWLALAHDLAHGTFYRPLVGELGYGGTRYFPLFFSLVAALMRAGVPSDSAGYAVSILAAVFLGFSVLRLLGESGVDRTLAIVAALLALAPHFVQETMTSVRSDILAVAFVTWGFAHVTRLTTRNEERGGSWLIAAASFTLAFATKPTALYGAVAGVVVLAANRRWSSLWRFALAVTAGVGATLGLMQVASAGRWFESFRACVMAGGSWRDIPVKIAEMTPALIGGSHLLTSVGGLAMATLIVTARRSWKQPGTVWFVAAAAATFVILGSPGTILTNQVIDLHVAAVVVLATVGLDAASARRIRQAGLLALLVVAAFQNVGRTFRLDLPAAAARASVDRITLIQAVDAFRKPVLSEWPQLPVAAGANPYVLDPFALRTVALTRPEFLEDLRGKLRREFFADVLLAEDPFTVRGEGWYRNSHFGWAVMDALLQHYRYARTIGRVRLYVPRNQPDQATVRCPGP